MCTCVCIHVCVCFFVHACVCACLPLLVLMCVCVCMCVCVWVCGCGCGCVHAGGRAFSVFIRVCVHGYMCGCVGVDVHGVYCAFAQHLQAYNYIYIYISVVGWKGGRGSSWWPGSWISGLGQTEKLQYCVLPFPESSRRGSEAWWLRPLRTGGKVRILSIYC